MQQVQPRWHPSGLHARNLHYQYFVAPSHRLVARKKSAPKVTRRKDEKVFVKRLFSPTISFSSSSVTLNHSILTLFEIAEIISLANSSALFIKKKGRVLALAVLSDIFRGHGIIQSKAAITRYDVLAMTMLIASDEIGITK